MELVLKCVASLKTRMDAFLADLRGVSTVEYALMVVAIVAAVGLAAGLLGDAFTGMFESLSKEMTGGVSAVKKAATAT